MQKEDYASRIVQFEMVNNTAVVVGGVAIEIFRSLSASLNFSYVLTSHFRHDN